MAIASLSASLLAYLLMLGGVSYQFSGQTDDKGTAWVELSSDEPQSGVKVKVTGSDGSGVEKTVNIKGGKATKITWKQKDRQVTYELEIEAGDGFTNGTFEVQRPTAGGKRGNLELLSGATEIVDDQKIRYKTPFTISKRTLQVYDPDGALITEKVAEDVIESGKTFEMTWRTNREVFMIKVTGEDETGYSATDTRVPWSFTVPHTDVNFDSGKSIIKSTEAPKVDETFAILAHELERIDDLNQLGLGQVPPLQLYIAGYTDTVGNPGDNQKLSEDRAKAIARYIHDKGLWCEIFYAGMGERGLAVETADSVDEVRNRRAEYILAQAKPAGGGSVPSAGAWRQLADARPRALQTLPELPELYVKWQAEQQKKRDAKYGTEGEGGDDGAGDDGAGDDDDDGDGEGSGSSRSDDDGDGGSEPYLGGTEEKPGATAKGCSTTQPANDLGVLAGLLGLLGLARRRRRD